MKHIQTYENFIAESKLQELAVNEEFDVSKIKAKDTIELTNTRTGDVGKYTVKKIFGGSSNIKEIEVLTRNNQLLTLYYSKERGLQNFKGDVYEYMSESKLEESAVNEYSKFVVGEIYNHPKHGKFEVIELARDSKTKVKFLEGSAKGDISYIAGYSDEGYLKESVDFLNEDAQKALTERTAITDIAQYYKDYNQEVKNAANALKTIVSGYHMRTSYDTELYDAIIELVNAVKQAK
jgi:hypothetical protein